MAARGRSRLARVAATALMGAGAKGAQLLLLIASVPLALPYLGPERYGAWMALSGLFAILVACDLGLPNGAMATVATALGRDDRGAMRTALGGAVAVLVAVGALALLAGACVWPWLDWRQLMNLTSEQAAREAGQAGMVLGVAYILGLPLAATTRVRHGLQEGWIAAAWDAGGSVLAIASLFLAVHLGAGLPWLAAAVSMPPVLAAAANAAHLILCRPWLKPASGDLAGNRLRPLLQVGSTFFILQVAASVVVAADPFLVARCFDPAMAGEFSVVQRLAILPNMAVGLALAPLWPAYAEAEARGDRPWIAATFRRSLLLTMVTALASGIGVVALGPWLVRLWTHGTIDPDRGLLLAQACWLGYGMAGGACAMLLNGLGQIRIQVVLAIALVVVALPLKFLGSHCFGPSGLVWATLTAGVCCHLLPFCVIIPRALRTPPQPHPAGA